jgi:mannose-6-phosphate isomerase
MGTHSKSPSKVASTDQLLSECLKADPSLIGERVANQFGAQDGNLPFLFKVLSIEKALSIQAHPDKKKAAALHSAKPDIYKGTLTAVNSTNSLT